MNSRAGDTAANATSSTAMAATASAAVPGSWSVGGAEFTSRLILGTARYPSPDVLRQAITSAGVELVTVSLRRELGSGAAGSSAASNQVPGRRFWEVIRSCNVRVLPNTAGCMSVREAVTTARMARDLFETNWVKLEVIGNDDTLQPDPFALVEAAGILVAEGFEVFPYTTEDLIVAERLLDAGCRVLMPWGAPIGTGQGLLNPFALRTLRERLPEATLIVDAGIGKPSQALQAMEMGFDAVLLNTAVALAHDPVRMAQAFAMAVRAGRLAREAGLMMLRDTASPSTPTVGMAFRDRPGPGEAKGAAAASRPEARTAAACDDDRLSGEIWEGLERGRR